MKSEIKPRSKAICILGMHRSGTSSITRAVNLLGAYIGEDADMMPAAPDNPKGFWERNDVFNLHRRILTHMKKTWDTSVPPSEGWYKSEDIKPFRDELVELIKNNFSDKELWTWKDPRSSILLSLWKDVLDELGIDLVCLVMVRNPLDVAKSLEKRNGFPFDKSFGLWLNYNLALLHSIPNIQHTFLSYDRFIDDWEPELKRCAAGLGIAWPGDDSQLREGMEAFVRPDLRHSTSGIAELKRCKAPQPVIKLYKLLETVMDAPSISDAPLFSGVDKLLKNFLEYIRFFEEDLAKVWELNNQLAKREKQLEEKDKQLNNLNRLLSDMKQYLSLISKSFQEQSGNIIELSGFVESLHSTHTEILKSLRWKTGDFICDLPRRILFRPRVPMAAEQFEITMNKFRSRQGIFKESELQFKANKKAFLKKSSLSALSPLVGATSSKPSLSDVIATTTDLDVIASEYLLDNLSKAPTVTIVIPIYNAYDDLVRCLESVVANTTSPAQILLINDKSTDSRIDLLLKEYETLENVRVLTNDKNMGFVKTVNRGLRECKGDVALLNSDIVLPPRWLENLLIAAYSDPRSATVSPVSNNAGAFSVPEVGKENVLPTWLTNDEVGRLISQHNNHIYTHTPTTNGFCMYIKRIALDDVGLFDVENFGRGYGEENDFCMRALRAGWNHIIDDATFVYHKRSASFGDEKHELMKSGREMIDKLYPEYTTLVRVFVNSNDMKSVRGQVQTAFQSIKSAGISPKKRVLYVLMEAGGGTPQTNMDLMKALSDRYSPYLLTSNRSELKLYRLDSEELVLVGQWELHGKCYTVEFSRPDYRSIIAHVLIEYQIELVHIRHLICHTFDIPEVASKLHIPIIMSFHDFYFVCPGLHLLDEKYNFCGGVCTKDTGEQCSLPTGWLEGTPLLKKGWITTWRSRVEKMFQIADAFVTTSQVSKDIYVLAFPILKDKRFRKIEHGRDLVQQSGLSIPPWETDVIRILVPGNMAHHKGAEFIRGLKQADTKGKLEFHFLGGVPAKYRDLGKCYGKFKREEYNSKVAQINPSFIGIFSIWPETYCHTLTEAWGAGVPVLITDMGTLKERLIAHGGGFAIDYKNPERAYHQIIEISKDKEAYIRESGRANLKGIRSVSDMAWDYDELYKGVLNKHKVFKSSDIRSSHSHDVLRIGMFVPGGHLMSPGSRFVRLLCWLNHPSVRDSLHSSFVDIDKFLSDETEFQIDIALVHRTAIQFNKADLFIEKCKKLNIPIIFEIDDNLIDLEGDSSLTDEYCQFKTSIEKLARVASVVTVSTPELKRVFSEYNSNVKILPNMLDEKLWFSPIETNEIEHDNSKADNDQQVNVIYIGSATHQDDLKIIRPVIERLQSQTDLTIKFFLIGGQKLSSDDSFYTRINIPNECKPYPHFVKWLRQQQGRWDVAIAPLVDNTLNKSKSYLKYLEYSALGLPGVYSSVAPFKSVIKDGVNGFICENTVDAWYTKLLEICKNKSKREEIRKNALEDVVNNHLIKDHISEYLDIFYHIRNLS